MAADVQAGPKYLVIITSPESNEPHLNGAPVTEFKSPLPLRLLIVCDSLKCDVIGRSLAWRHNGPGSDQTVGLLPSLRRTPCLK